MTSWLPEAASSYAGDIDRLMIFITVIVGIWFLVAEGILIGFALRYRRRAGHGAKYLPATTLRTMSFVLIPCAIMLGFDLLIDGIAAPVWEKVKIDVPPPDELVRIEGQAWQWNFTYPGADGLLDTADDVSTFNELHVPVDRTIVFELTARDVLHSLWVPAFRLKQDAVPGRTIRGWFRATREGEYPVVCAEICGIAHTLMAGKLRVESEAEFRQWLEARASAMAPARN